MPDDEHLGARIPSPRDGRRRARVRAPRSPGPLRGHFLLCRGAPWGLPPGGCPLGAAPWGLPLGRCPVGSALGALPPGLCPWGAAPWALPLGRCPLGSALGALPPGRCPLGAALGALPPGRCPRGAAPWALPQGSLIGVINPICPGVAGRGNQSDRLIGVAALVGVINPTS